MSNRSDHSSTIATKWATTCEIAGMMVMRSRDGHVFDRPMVCKQPGCSRCGPSRLKTFMPELAEHITKAGGCWVSTTTSRAAAINGLRQRLRDRRGPLGGCWIDLYGGQSIIVTAADHGSGGSAEFMRAREAIAMLTRETESGFVKRRGFGGWTFTDAARRKTDVELIGTVVADRAIAIENNRIVEGRTEGSPVLLEEDTARRVANGHTPWADGTTKATLKEAENNVISINRPRREQMAGRSWGSSKLGSRPAAEDASTFEEIG